MTSDDNIHAHLKIAVAMRAVRGALGLSQSDLAELIGVSKPTVARIETLEVPMRFDAYANMMKNLKKIGVNVDTVLSDNVQVEFEPQALTALLTKLSDQGKRRKDRVQKGVGVRQASKKNADDADADASVPE